MAVPVCGVLGRTYEHEQGGRIHCRLGRLALVHYDLRNAVHAIISRMFDDSRRKEITVRVIRDGLPEPPDNDWSAASPEERIEAVWTLTELCLAWNNPSSSEPRLQRAITRVQRAQR